MADLQGIIGATMYGQAVSLRDILYFLKIHERLTPFEEAITGLLMCQVAARENMTVSNAELQRAADSFRQEHKLYKALDTMHWLQQQHMTVLDLERRLEHTLLGEKLRDKVTAGKVERYFTENKSAFDTAKIAHIVVQKDGVASELFSQITEEEADFAILAHRHSLDAASRDAGGYVGIVKRKALSPAAAAAIFTAVAGSVVGPVKTSMGYHVIQVQALYPGTLDGPTQAAIKDVLFAEWLREETRKANVVTHITQLL